MARFSTAGIREELERHGIETIACDLLDRKAVEALPKFANVIFMAGFKFGAGNDPGLTWAMNVLVPAIVAETFAVAHRGFLDRLRLSLRQRQGRR